MLVDDNIEVLAWVSEALSKNFELTLANNGVEALAIVASKSWNYFKVILADVKMPLIDGFDFCEQAIAHF